MGLFIAWYLSVNATRCVEGRPIALRGPSSHTYGEFLHPFANVKKKGMISKTAISPGTLMAVIDLLGRVSATEVVNSGQCLFIARTDDLCRSRISELLILEMVLSLYFE